MADDNKSGLSEVAEKSASAANAIKGAVKVGKAVSGAAKGAAVGGPYGAVAGALWENRKLVGKIIAAAAFLLLLPVLFILMLPSLIFGGFNSSAPPADNAPILNDNAAIYENINDITFAVSGILGEGVDDVKARIVTDFTASGGDNYEIIDPFEGDPTYNVNLFISQYCAAKDTDIDNSSLPDMESIFRGGKNHLYTFARTQEVREIPPAATPAPTTTPTTSAPPATPAPPTYETWIIYTIVYNGEGYFADSVFRLTDEQKTLAQNYAENLSMFLGDGALQYLADSEYGGVSYVGIVFSDGLTPVTYYNQLDALYKNEPYGTDNIGGYACGPASMAIVVSSLTSETVDPIQMAKWAYDNGYWCSKSGSYHTLIPGAAKHWNLPVEGCTASEPQRIVDALASGKLVVALMTKGHFTSSGHFIVLRGVTSSSRTSLSSESPNGNPSPAPSLVLSPDGHYVDRPGTPIKILVADPASYKRSEQEWDLSLILNEASKRAGAGGPFWLIG